MLVSLSIKNIAIIDALEVEFSSGMNVMTGETGSGKTVILGALGLLLGERASTDIIRSGEESATVSARFILRQDAHALRRALDDVGISSDDELIVHRLISTTGKGKAVINGVPVTTTTLKEISRHLIDISTQHEHQLLLNPAEQGAILDRFGELSGLVNIYVEQWNTWTKCSQELTALRARERQAKEQIDFLKFQYQEIHQAQLRSGEEEELIAQRDRIRHGVKLSEKMQRVEALLGDDVEGILTRIAEARRLLDECAKLDTSIVSLQESVGRADVEIGDCVREVTKYREALDMDPAALETLEDRLHVIRGLVRKHGGTVEACLEKLKHMTSEIDLVERFDELSAEKENETRTAEEHLEHAAQQLSGARTKAAKILATGITRELDDLGMKRTKIEVRVTPKLRETWDASGPDTIEFFISPNVGEELRPLHRIASGGELSRILLAIKRVIMDRVDMASTSFFDEVDAGIGGATASAVGRKLKEVASQRQVICITHLPQVAACGERHFVIRKSVGGGRTRTDVIALDASRRVEEIARMLGGSTVTKGARENAAELLRSAL